MRIGWANQSFPNVREQQGRDTLDVRPFGERLHCLFRRVVATGVVNPERVATSCMRRGERSALGNSALDP